MTEALAYIQKSLEDNYPPQEIRSFTRLIMEHVCSIPPHKLLSDKDKELSNREKEEITGIVKRLLQSEPIQYILGKTCFYGYDFLVNPSTLIPRPETEELIDYILSDHKEEKLRLLDIGTGSGCIAVTFARERKGAEVIGIDISSAAIDTARENARLLQTENITFIQADILSESQSEQMISGKFDLIVSNPPYIMEKEKDSMEKNVLGYEPGSALFVPDHDPLLFYRRIAQFGKKRLNPGGQLYFEINALLGKEMVGLVNDEGYKEIKLIPDLSGKDRFIKAMI